MPLTIPLHIQLIFPREYQVLSTSMILMNQIKQTTNNYVTNDEKTSALT